jgi:hypothetical protein
MANQVDLFGALTVHRLAAAANSENATVVSTHPTRMFHFNGTNAKAGITYIKFYDQKTTPSETDAPWFTFACTASVPFNSGALGPLRFTTGLAYRIVTGAADSDDTAVAANDILALNVVYS